MYQGKKAVLVGCGTRADAIKLAPLVRELRNGPWTHPVVAASGPDRDAMDQVNGLFGIVPDVDLGLTDRDLTLTETTTHALSAYSSLLDAQDVDAVVIAGGTTTALAAALAGFHAKRPVVHVEAGLRTGCFYAPFPEEVNRRLIGQIASLHLAPTWMNRANLLEEGVYPADVSVTGSTVIDALSRAASMRMPTGDRVVDAAIAERRQVVLVTVDRRAGGDSGLAAIGRAVAAVARARPELLMVVPVDAAAAVRKRLLPPLKEIENVRVIPPLPYGPFAWVLSRSTLVLTDSGSIQEEAPAFGVPVLVARDTTERPEAVETGAARLVGTQSGAIVHAVEALLDRIGRAAATSRTSTAPVAASADASVPEYRTGHRAPHGVLVSPFGDGQAAARMRSAIEELLGVGQRIPEFAAPVPLLEEAKAS
ncbi:non-hydrolyzing UDP-N-acetylglucosamine 2-epimerase [Phytoactinopolyspora halotolerans]|uniref:UDP-N-acetylglucosamine 2-epimerase (non-hydrolyzing) n=1 Tax=Phytoactinopolyspora halotolerans TaxID=1981512 RepID=A0A6L9SDV9_9ACTN|nr:UDP-N-acetylglucosamine 2-epimerase (non-hydrolyzing) [Phytoactinopolyspora halotolerans]NEE03297.1 UDP-N-acetylglucosamine 2-epimerase (non-hydrolyzing) [Phytoactinopolyspora halotolerans]